jgi:hypothetical protein
VSRTLCKRQPNKLRRVSFLLCNYLVLGVTFSLGIDIECRMAFPVRARMLNLSAPRSADKL